MLGQILSHLHMITAETYLMFEVFYSCEESILRKNLVLTMYLLCYPGMQ